VAFVLATIYVTSILFGASFPMANPSLVILILFLGGCQLLAIGILGEYLGRIYDEVRQRPKFILDQMFGFEKTSANVPAPGDGSAEVSV
jgi:dolichol-phosphate mannosyltransferase